MNTRYFLTLIMVFLSGISYAQTYYYGTTSSGGNSNEGTIFKTDSTGTNLQTVFSFDYHQEGRSPKNIFTEAANGKIYGTTKFGGNNICSFPYYQYQKHSGVMFEYDPATSVYTALYHFGDTASGCWPESAPVQAANGKLYGLTSGGGSSHNYGVVYSYDLTSSTYTVIHAFLGSYAAGSVDDGVQPVGNLLLAADGKLYGITRSGGNGGRGIIFKIDPTTDTYSKLSDMKTSSSNIGYNAEAGLTQAPNGKMYGTTQSGGSTYNGNIFEYNPTTNVVTSLHDFTSDSLGVYPYGSLALVGSNDLYCVTYKHFTAPGASWPNIPHYYLWKYSISTATAVVVDSIANGSFSRELTTNANGKILITGFDNNVSSAARFWEFDPTTNTRTLVDTSTVLSATIGLMQASNGKYYGGFNYNTSWSAYANGDGAFVEYDASNHIVNKKFNFSDPVDGLKPEGDLMMASNGKLYGMTSKGGVQNKGVVFEYNPTTNIMVKKFDLDSLSGYEPKGGLMEASNGKFYALTYRGGDNSFGTILEIDTNTWTLVKKQDFSSSIGTKPMGKMVEAWDGKLYGLTAYNGGAIFQYDIAANTLTNKHSFVTNDGTYPQGSLALADNGKLYGLTNYGGASSYSKGTLFEYDPASSTFSMKKEMYNYTGYNSQGNTPLMGSDGIMYLLLSCGGSGNTEYAGGSINEYIPGMSNVTNKASFSVNNTGSKPLGDLMESGNGKLYGYTYVGGANSKGTIFEYDPTLGTIVKKVDFNGSNGALPVHGSLTESNTAPIIISQQIALSSACIGDTAYLSIAANHATLLHYQWYKNGVSMAGETNDSLAFYNLSLSDTANYTCRITGGTKAVVSNVYTLAPVVKPVVSISGIGSDYCVDNADISVQGSPTGGLFLGTNVSVGMFSPVYAGVGTHNIIYSFTNAQGCSNTDTVSVIINALPDATFTGFTTTYCDNNETDTLIPNVSGGTFSGTSLTNNIFDPTYFASSNGLAGFATFVYTITDANACTNKDTVTVTVYHAPNVNLSGLDAEYCANDATDTLETSPTGGTISAGSLLNGMILTPSVSNVGVNNIYYSYTNSFGCTNSDTLQILVHGLPDATFTGLDANYCVNYELDTLIPTTTGGTFSGDIVNVNIFDPQTVTIPGGALSVMQSVIYTITDNNSCTSVDTVTTMIYPLPIVNFGALPSTFCNNGADVLLNNATPIGGTFSGNGVNGSTFNPSNAGIGVSTLVYSYTNSNNCTNMDTVSTEVLQAPEFQLPNDTNICINNTITLSTGLSAGYTYLWNDGSTNDNLIIDASTVGVGTYNYSVTVMNTQNSCEENDDMDLTINACTGISENLDNDVLVNIYPNPSNGKFTIATDMIINSVKIYSSRGKLVFSKNLEDHNSEYTIDLGEKATGIYYILIIGNDDIINKKMIIN